MPAVIEACTPFMLIEWICTSLSQVDLADVDIAVRHEYPERRFFVIIEAKVGIVQCYFMEITTTSGPLVIVSILGVRSRRRGLIRGKECGDIEVTQRVIDQTYLSIFQCDALYSDLLVK
jgi:hypothetical protein